MLSAPVRPPRLPFGRALGQGFRTRHTCPACRSVALSGHGLLVEQPQLGHTPVQQPVLHYFAHFFCFFFLASIPREPHFAVLEMAMSQTTLRIVILCLYGPVRHAGMARSQHGSQAFTTSHAHEECGRTSAQQMEDAPEHRAGSDLENAGQGILSVQIFPACPPSRGVHRLHCLYRQRRTRRLQSAVRSERDWKRTASPMRSISEQPSAAPRPKRTPAPQAAMRAVRREATRTEPPASLPGVEPHFQPLSRCAGEGCVTPVSGAEPAGRYATPPARPTCRPAPRKQVGERGWGEGSWLPVQPVYHYLPVRMARAMAHRIPRIGLPIPGEENRT